MKSQHRFFFLCFWHLFSGGPPSVVGSAAAAEPEAMPRLGHYSEKYELNGSGSEQPAASYGSFRRDEQGALLSHDHLLVSLAAKVQTPTLAHTKRRHHLRITLQPILPEVVSRWPRSHDDEGSVVGGGIPRRSRREHRSCARPQQQKRQRRRRRCGCTSMGSVACGAANRRCRRPLVVVASRSVSPPVVA